MPRFVTFVCILVTCLELHFKVGDSLLRYHHCGRNHANQEKTPSLCTKNETRPFCFPPSTKFGDVEGDLRGLEPTRPSGEKMCLEALLASACIAALASEWR